MDWINIHTSTLDSPEFVCCDPTRRATWLMVFRFCAGQENGGRIVGAKAWGDTTWQQMARVRLREVRAESTLWGWDGDDLILLFYPTEKECEVREKRRGGTLGGGATSAAKTQAARANGVKGGRPVTQAEPKLETQAEPKLNPNSNPTEGKGKERKGKEVSAATPPHAREPTPQPTPPICPDDESELSSVLGVPPGESAAIGRACDKRSFPDWRITIARRLFWTREEDETWKALYAAEGWDAMSAAYRYLAAKTPEPKKIFISMFQEIRE